MIARLERFRARCQQSPLDHAQQSLLNAVEDLNDAIHLAVTPADLAKLRVTIRDTVATLMVSDAVAGALAELEDR